MRAARIHGVEDVRVEEVERPRPAAGQVLVEVASSGICGTDAHLFRHGAPLFPDDPRSQWPLVLGHEFAGRVVEVGAAVEDLRAGELVVSGAGVSCGVCRACRTGRTNLCETYWTLGVHRHGGLAEYCAAPAATCVRVEPYGVGEDAAGLAQPMAVAEHAVARGRLARGERALMIGAGGIGTFAVWAAAQRGAALTVCDRDAARLRTAVALGADVVVLATDDAGPLAEQLDAHGPWDVVYEMTGRREPFEAAVALARRGTRVVAVGLQTEPRPLDLARLAIQEIELIGTMAHVCGTDVPSALRLLAAREEGWSDVTPRLLPLADLVEEGLRPLAEGRAAHVKTLVDPRAHAPRAFRD